MLMALQPWDSEKNYKLLPKCHQTATTLVTFILYTEDKENNIDYQTMSHSVGE
ncbi:MAG: hypothetical protein PVF83_07955 [Anaerolineales bacterium]|jgi:hypothetical protein